MKPIKDDELEGVLAAIAAVNKAMAVDLDSLVLEKELKKTAREKMADELARHVPVKKDGRIRNSKKQRGKRADGKKKVSSLKKHWKTRRKIEKIRKDRENAARLGRRKAQGIEWLRDGTAEGLWNYLTKQGKWSRAAWRPLWKISKKDFMDHIYPHVSYCVPNIYRHDLKKPVTMRNSVWKDGKTVLFDGAEWWLHHKSGLQATEISAILENDSVMWEDDTPVSLTGT